MHPTHILRRLLGLGELVKKIETSATAHKKRLRISRRKHKAVTKEQRRIARDGGLYAVAVTLTYANSVDFSSKHVSRFMNCLRVKLKRQGHSLPYTWVLERASTLHYHLLLWLPRGFKLSHRDLKSWWPWGSTWCEACRKVSKWAKYMRKSDTKTKLPHSARVFGCGGLDETGKEEVRKAMLPRWLALLMPASAILRRIPRIGWVDMSTGDIFECPWMWTPYGMALKPQKITP